ncbi:universal stress protein [Micromonospora sp. CPCC 206060]|uniref:universal stress protein n=1 Tax=Micromonospora sp. CPCC 206060 TaxID=3122406 RepID=UPI002FF141BA
MAGIGGTGRIVVGVDGSPASKDALRWAARQAAVAGGTVEAVMAWEYPTYYGWGQVPDVDFEGGARATLTEAVDDALGGDRTIDVDQVVVAGNAAQVLIDAAKDAVLLVVGSRGHGGFTGALLGSISQHCTQHATCPVVVIRHATA